MTAKVKTGLVTGGSERIAFSIVRVDVRYPDGIVGIVLQYCSSTKIYLYIVNSALVCTEREREREDGKQTVSDREGEGSSLSSSTKSLV